MSNITFSKRWHTTFLGGHIGYLIVSGVDNSKRPSALDEQKKVIVTAVRHNFAGQTRADLIQNKTLKAYRTYYKKFNKTYHVLQQLESILHKGKGLPSVNPLVDAAFTAEIETLILTASHDLDKLTIPLTFDATDKDERFIQMRGREQSLKANDMVMRDANGPTCTIIYGQDNISPISPQTKTAIYVAYCPAGISSEQVQLHLETIKQNILRFQADAVFEFQEVISASAIGAN